MWSSLLLLFSASTAVNAAITVLNQQPLGTHQTGTATANAASYTGSAAYDPTQLTIPPLPDPAPSLEFQILLDGTAGASIEHTVPMFGFSIEMSISNTILGVNGSFLNVPFLNAMAAVTQRAGEVHIRVGGNSQEGAVLVDSLPNGRVIQKETDEALLTGTTRTPPIMYTDQLMHMMANISSLVPVKWYMGIPFNDTNYRLGIVSHSQAILGDLLLGLQAGNEPDFYPKFGRRPSTWGPGDYYTEVGNLIQLLAPSDYDVVRDKLIVPSVSNQWNVQDVWNTGLLDTYNANVRYVTMERYPSDNCAAQFGTDPSQIIDPNTLFPKFLVHSHPRTLVAPYIGYANFALSKGKPFIMFETNTASCGGFHGLSNSFGGGLWIMDYGLQMAYGNLSQALLHVGGQQAYYNPFTPPPTNQSTFHQWTMGPALYAAVIMGEVIGNSGKARVKETFANGNNDYTPSYVIYENEQPVRVALINYMSDNSGAHDYFANLAWPQGATVPSQVKVKTWKADNVSVINGYTWAGQNFGPTLGSDGRLQGDMVIDTVQCQNGQCRIHVPGPSLVLVFLTDDALTESNAKATQTFPTTAATRTQNTATVDPAVLATSNGHSALEKEALGSTSPGSRSGASRVGVGLVTAGMAILGTLMVVLGVV